MNCLNVIFTLLSMITMTKVMVVKSDSWIEIRNTKGKKYNGKLDTEAAFTEFGPYGYYRFEGPLNLGKRSETWGDGGFFWPYNAIIQDRSSWSSTYATLEDYQLCPESWPNAIRVDCLDGYSCSEDGIQIKKAKFGGKLYKNFALVPNYNFDSVIPKLEEVNTCGTKVGAQISYTDSDVGATYEFNVYSCLTMKPDQFYEILNYGDEDPYLLLKVANPLTWDKNSPIDLGSCDYYWNKDLAVCGGTSTYGCSDSNGNGCDDDGRRKLDVVDDDGGNDGDDNQSGSVFGDIGMVTTSQQDEEQRGLLRGAGGKLTVVNDPESGASVTFRS